MTTALRLESQGRYTPRGQPPLIVNTRAKRREFACDHLEWTNEDWEKTLWSDEAWVIDGIHRKVWITRGEGEGIDKSCITQVLRKKTGWMLWGCFAGRKKGASIFWEKDWGTWWQSHTRSI